VAHIVAYLWRNTVHALHRCAGCFTYELLKLNLAFYETVKTRNSNYFSDFREGLQRFIWSMRDADGSFSMHQGGECDMRGAYCALAVAKLTNIYKPELFENTAEWIVR